MQITCHLIEAKEESSIHGGEQFFIDLFYEYAATIEKTIYENNLLYPRRTLNMLITIWFRKCDSEKLELHGLHIEVDDYSKDCNYGYFMFDIDGSIRHKDKKIRAQVTVDYEAQIFEQPWEEPAHICAKDKVSKCTKECIAHQANSNLFDSFHEFLASCCCENLYEISQLLLLENPSYATYPHIQAFIGELKK